MLVLAGADRGRPALGATVRAAGGSPRPTVTGLAALLLARGDPEVRAPDPDFWWRGAAAVRQSLRESVSHMPRAQRALVPALVVGDDSALPADVADGLPHDRADAPAGGVGHQPHPGGRVPAGLARWCRVRGRWLVVVGAAGVVGFVLLARTEPSVLRAAVMGTVA